MILARTAFLMACVLQSVVGQEPAPTAAPAKPVSFHQQIRPILQASCHGCHQPARVEGDLILTSHAELLAAEDLIVPGAPKRSMLVDVVTPHGEEAPEMPDDGKPLSEADVQLISRWIAEGASDDTPANEQKVYSRDDPPVYDTPGTITSLAFSPDQTLLAVPGLHEVMLWKADGSALVARLIGLAQRIESIAFSPDGKSLAAVGGSPGRLGEVQVWSLSDYELAFSRAVTFDSLFGASWSPDGSKIAFGCTDATVRVIDSKSGEQVLYQSAHSDWVLGTVFSTDASHLVTVSRDRSMKLTLVASQQFIDNITSITPGALHGGLMAVDRHPTKDELLIGGSDGTPRLYRMYRKKKRVIGDDFNLLKAFEALSGRVFAARFNSDGSRIVVASSHQSGGTLRVCDVKTGKTLWTQNAPQGLFAATFGGGDKVIAAGGFDGIVRLHNAASGEVITEFAALPFAAQSTVKATTSSEVIVR